MENDKNDILEPQRDEIGAEVQTASTRLAAVATLFADPAAPIDKLADGITGVMDILEPVLYALGYELDIGEFFDDPDRGWTGSTAKRARAAESSIPDLIMTD